MSAKMKETNNENTINKADNKKKQKSIQDKIIKIL